MTYRYRSLSVDGHEARLKKGIRNQIILLSHKITERSRDETELARELLQPIGDCMGTFAAHFRYYLHCSQNIYARIFNCSWSDRFMSWL